MIIQKYQRSKNIFIKGLYFYIFIAEELPHPDREELVRLATLHDLPIEVCEGDDLLQSHGGVGCLLRNCFWGEGL